MLKVTLTASLLATLSVASAAQTYIRLLNPTQTYVTGQGVLKLPFSYQPVAPESGRAMYRDPVVQGNFEQLGALAGAQGFRRDCQSRELHLIPGRDSADLKAKEGQWISALQSAQGYTLRAQAALPPYSAEGETVSGTAYLLKVPGLNVLQTYGFYRYAKAHKSWLLVCGAGPA